MKKKNKFMETPSVILLMSIVALVLGIGGINRLLNAEGMYDIFIGVSLAITGFTAGVLSVRQYNLMKKQRVRDTTN
ncbi:hypothetical protein [Radiobacillus sp. PE A8.2]|uniref:hypothetical protein n=1 Tax=Radiobacillus sp. PE A8.2 TaxID=3380349 RepID=UPI0038908077